jgi:hypothetical protein
MALNVLVVPFVVSALVLAASRWAFRRAGMSGAGPAAAVLGLGAGYLAGHLAAARPAFPPIEVTDRVPWLAAASALLGLLESARPAPGWARWENRLLLTALVMAVVLGPVLEETGASGSGRIWLAGVALALLASWANLEALATRLSVPSLGLPVLAVVAGAGAVLVLSGSLVLGELGLALASSLGATWLLSLFWNDLSLARGGPPFLVATLGSLLLVGHVYAGLPTWPAVALLAAPLAIWSGFLGPLRRAATWKRTLLSLAATLALVGIAILLALSASPPYDGSGE